MDKLLPKLYKNYGKYINSFRAFPLDIDGLKPVERRVLLTTYQSARDKFVKSATIDGFTIGKYHPHASCYGTISQLVNNNFLDKQGNFGSNTGVEPDPPAASRYTECKMSKRTINLAFKLVNYVKWVEAETKLYDEPEYLPTMFPFCLIGTNDTRGIGFGYSTYIPTYDIKDLYNRLLWLLGRRKTEPIIKPKTDCKITASNSDLKDLLTKGKAKISIIGEADIIPIKCKMVLKSWSPNQTFKTILKNKKIEKYLKNQDMGWVDSSTSVTKIIWEVAKQRNRDKIFNNFIKDFKQIIESSISYECVMVDLNRNVKVMSVDEMLLKTYNTYFNVNKNMLNTEIGKIDKTIHEYENLEKIRPYLSKYLKNKIIDVEETIKNISIDSNVSENEVKELFTKYNINKLLTLDTDISSLEQKKNEYNLNLKDIDNYVLEQYNNFVKVL